MIVPTPWVSDLALPPDDGAIYRAIDELRTKIALWSRAVVEVENRLGDQAAEPHEVSVQPASDVDGSAQRQVEFKAPADTEAILPTTDVPLAAVESADRTDATRSEPSAGETTRQPQSEAEIEARLESLDPTVANTVRRRRQEEASGESINNLIEACDLELQDDDDLLALLAPEMAEAIRVEYRLFNGRRSIRELIEAHRDNLVESRERRRWWQRGKR